MKTKLNLCMLLLLGATVSIGVKAMETEEKDQTKITVHAENEMKCKDGVCAYKPKNAQHDKQIKSEANRAQVIELHTETSFFELVRNESKPVVVDFYATWCTPCKYMKPIFEELAKQKDGYVFAAIDGSDHPGIMKEYNVEAVPSFLVFKNGKVWGKIKGRKSKDELLFELEKIIASENPIEYEEVKPSIDNQIPVIIPILGLFCFFAGVHWWYSDMNIFLKK